MIVTVIAHPRSKRPRISEQEPGIFNVYVAEPPTDGKANQAIVAALADYFGIAKYRVKIVKGQTGKRKIVELSSYERYSMI
jgi:uncharacterized protein